MSLHHFIPDLIQKKRDKRELTDDEVRYFIDQLVKRQLEDSQLGISNLCLFYK